MEVNCYYTIQKTTNSIIDTIVTSFPAKLKSQLDRFNEKQGQEAVDEEISWMRRIIWTIQKGTLFTILQISGELFSGSSD
jgi:hypothetical protein